MAKELLLNALVGVLGDYIEGITKENLKVGVWSGKIELQHLQLNSAGIEKLKLPVNIINGFVDSLKVSIPWTALGSQPVKININGVYLLLGPVDVANLDPQEAAERTAIQNRNKLIQAEKSIELAAQLTEHSDPKNATYMQNLTTKIVDNIEISVTNIHLRYEDKRSFPNETFSFGLTLERFLVTTTNEKWEEAFVAREADSKVRTVHKIARLENCLVYWNVTSPELGGLPFNIWMRTMQELVFKSSSPVNSLQYILSPPNSLLIKLIHNDAEGVIPRLQASVESNNVGFFVDKSQYHQMMRTMDVYNTLLVKQRLLQYRPALRPNLQPREWWRYALLLLTNNERIFDNKVYLFVGVCRCF
jgi:vacuolar protein sorting-associated protein 13A/C